MWLPLTRRTRREALAPETRPMTSSTQGPAALAMAFARAFDRLPSALVNSMSQPSPVRRAEVAAVRVSTVAPRSRASSALSTTRRASSTQQSEYSKARV